MWTKMASSVKGIKERRFRTILHFGELNWVILKELEKKWTRQAKGEVPSPHLISNLMNKRIKRKINYAVILYAELAYMGGDTGNVGRDGVDWTMMSHLLE